MLAVPACSSPSSAPRPDLAVAAADARPLSASDILFPDLQRVDGPVSITPDAQPPDSKPPPPDAFSATLSVTSSQTLGWKSACGSVPIESPTLSPGSYTISLTASTISKGSHHDDYLLIGLPVEAGSVEESLRYLVLNGVGAKRDFSVSKAGVVRAWFLDSDKLNNTGSATATITPGDHALTVGAASNVIAWLDDCKTMPAELELPAGSHRLTLTASSFSSAPGLADPHLVLRLPLEGDESTKFISLNGIGDSKLVTLPAFGILRAWFVAEATGSQSGQATVTVTAP